MTRATIVIKKYENRRLYDTTNSRYVNLDEVAQAVREGHEVQVVDAATGEDITRLVLTQIIVDNAKAPNSAFPLDILRQMVMATGRASQEGTLKYMKAMFDMYQTAYRAVPQPMGPFDFMMGGAGMRPPQTEATPPAPPTPSSAEPKAARRTEQEFKDLQRRVEELSGLVEEMMSEQETGKRKGRK